jgi:Glycosyltransferase family 87
MTSSSDLAVPYLAARAWRTGDNPYDHDTLDNIWQQAGGEQEKKPVKTTTPSVYPPTTLIILAPLTLWSWNTARYGVLIVNIILAIVVIRLLLSTAQLPRGDWRTITYWAIALGLAPLHTGIALGNLIVPSGFSALLAVWAASTKKEDLAGLSLALALCLKPQIGGIAWLGFALQRQWKICVTAAASTLILALIAVVRLEFGHVDWVNSWVRNYHEFTAEGRSNDPTAANVSRHHLLNLHWLLHTFIQQGWLVNLLVLGFVGSQFALLLRAINKRVSHKNELLFFSSLFVLGLLATYHRFYDAILLFLPLLWSLISWSGLQKKSARLCFFLITPFLAPGAVILKELIGSGYLPRDWESSWWWNSIVMPHQVWLLAVLSVCLTYALVVSSRNSPNKEDHGQCAS